MSVEAGEGALALPEAPLGNKVGWLDGARVLHASYARGAFRGALGRVLATVTVGAELVDAVRARGEEASAAAAAPLRRSAASARR